MTELPSSDLSALFGPEYQAINEKLYRLTIREWDVLALLAEGLTNSQVAAILCVEVKSIENYKGRIGNKLNLRGKFILERFCYKHSEHLKKFYKIVKSEM